MRKSFGISVMMVGVFASVACGPEMEGEGAAENGDEGAIQSVEQSASTTRTATVVKVAASTCDVATEISCAGLVRHCVPACTIDKNSWACKSCIEYTFTFGVDCWSCLYNRPSGSVGGVVPPSEFYSCRSFAAGDPDDTSHPRYRSPTSKIQETCQAPVYNYRTRRWTKWCCLYRVR